MTEEDTPPKASGDDLILQQKYLRALSSFEGIVLSQIDVKNRLGDRLSYSIRTGITILGVIAFSILILLFTLTSQATRISGVVANMNTHFGSISQKMDKIKNHMSSMEEQVSLLNSMEGHIDAMNGEMILIDASMNTMQGSVSGIKTNLSALREEVGGITISIDQMNFDMQGMSREMHRMGKPARSMNKMFPFP